ncbi:Zn-dependent alcohol dehydrogenase [Nocardioides pocheonensis]|uniref:Zn-dependent alcohol dehydrogenase n=1 Tax=Nocardioides pocheonensis TaxID=661485 RepID=A0A3N0GLV9_9ACTN|nr:Zn-dependent alcohol dehydrogenase [Nocardioides pocheonensis]
MMLAARYVGDRGIEVATVEAAPPGPGEVQVAVAYTGICGTDLHIRHGDMDARVDLPAVVGHEMSGRVVACGPDVHDWHPGDAVTVMPLRWCGSCSACTSGHQHICERLDFMGIDSPGSMQQLWTVPSDVLVHLPPALELAHGALVEPTAVAVHDVRRADLRPGERVVVVGGGPVGILIASVAAADGADVVVLEVNGYRRSVAEGLGLATLDPTDGDVGDRLRGWSQGGPVGASFEVSGTQPGMEVALACLGPRGRMVQVGIHAQPRTVDLHQVFWRELSILGARVYERSDFERAVALLAAGHVAADALISRVQPLESAAAAFDELAAGGEVMKILVRCGDVS